MDASDPAAIDAAISTPPCYLYMSETGFSEYSLDESLKWGYDADS